MGCDWPTLKGEAVWRKTIGMMEKNDTAMILGLVTAIERQIREVLGLESSHLYCHPLWQPMIETRSTGDAQLVGFELFGIDRYIRQLNGISHIRLLLECELHSPDEEWHFEPSCDRQTFCGCDFQGLGREWHWGILTSDVPSPICDTAVTRL